MGKERKRRGEKRGKGMGKGNEWRGKNGNEWTYI